MAEKKQDQDQAQDRSERFSYSDDDVASFSIKRAGEKEYRPATEILKKKKVEE